MFSEGVVDDVWEHTLVELREKCYITPVSWRLADFGPLHQNRTILVIIKFF